jgi:hypothetical protein
MEMLGNEKQFSFSLGKPVTKKKSFIASTPDDGKHEVLLRQCYKTFYSRNLRMIIIS